MRPWAALPLIFFAVAAARADVIELDGGREMKGLITRETKSEVELDIGYGSVTLKRSDIRAIRRSKPKDRAPLLKARRLKALEEGEGAPESEAALAAAYAKAARAREDLREARALAETVEGGDSELAELIADNKKAARALGAADRAADPEGYNRLVSEFNRVTAEINARQLEDLERRNARSGAHDRSRAYMAAYQDFARELRSPRPSPEDAEFLALMREALAGMDRDFDREKVEAERSGAHWIVTALLDGRVPARLLVDTGASMVVISREIADQLTQTSAKRGTAQTSVADGRKVTVDLLELASVEVGRSRAEGVQAAVMAERPEDKIDGLLGMSFLNRFGFESDPRSGVFYLRRLKAEPAKK